MSDQRNNEVKISTETKTVAEVIINGTSQGKREINGGPSLKEFATSLAQEFGIRTFTVTIDGSPVKAADANKPLQPGSTVAVSAKDSRGAATAAPQKIADGPEDDGAATDAAASDMHSEGAPAQADGAGEQTDPTA